MTKRLFLSIAVLFTAISFAQAPNKMSYQSVVRDTKGALVSNAAVSVQVSVLKGSEQGTAVFTELHKTKTNANGLVSLAIGGGEAITGSFKEINWSDGSYFIQTATDPDGGSNYSIVGVSELLSVPYALSARSADNAFSGNYDDLQNKPSKLSQFVNDLDWSANAISSNSRTAAPIGIPAQVWSLFGNSNTNAAVDKLGTTDFKDLVLVTNNLDRLRIQANGDINIRRSLEVGEDLTVNKNVYLNVLGGQTINNGNFSVANTSTTLLTGTLNVNGATDLDNTLNVDGITDLNSTLNVNNAAATNLSGVLNVDGATDLNNTLNVDGVTDLNSALTVNNAAATNLTGVLNVDGATDLNNTLNVDGASNLNATLIVNGATTLNNTLSVDGVTDLNNALSVDGSTTLNNSLSANGQVTISTNVGGGDGAYGAYPLRVQGSSQGIAVKLTAGTPDNDNNFITFFNSGGGAVGRIEGETDSEALTDPEYIYDNSILLAEEIKAGVNVGLAAIPVVVAGLGASAGPCGACLAMAAADLVLATANLIAYNVFATENLGVTYQSGSADYAEWLERSNFSERIVAGDIVAVNGGKITKNTQNAQQYMVISTKPAILGNMPMDGNEKAYEKVAFMGQIPVKVRGVAVSGDYILPSGLNDGTGIAVAPSEIKAAQYREIIGVAWSDALIAGGISTINMAIGLNGNDVATLAMEQENKIKALETKYNSLEQRLLALESGKVLAPAPTAEAIVSAEKVTSRNEKLAANMPAELNAAVMEEAMTYLQDMYKKQGIDIKAHKGLDRLFNDAAYRASVIKKAQDTYKMAYPNALKAAKKM